MPVSHDGGKMRKIMLVRGVNVGGVKLPMKGFCEMLQSLGLERVRSYIQSGNVVFDDPGLPDLKGAIAKELKAQFGLSSALFIYDRETFETIMSANPFLAEARIDGAKVFAFFLDEPAVLDVSALQTYSTSERFHLTNKALFLHAQDGIGRSLLAEKVQRQLKVLHTARNWNTVRAILELSKT